MIDEMNVLITSVSRKVWLVEALRRAVAPPGGRVMARESRPLAVGLTRDAALPGFAA
jgi:hypothetical protein